MLPCTTFICTHPNTDTLPHKNLQMIPHMFMSICRHCIQVHGGSGWSMDVCWVWPCSRLWVSILDGWHGHRGHGHGGGTHSDHHGCGVIPHCWSLCHLIIGWLACYLVNVSSVWFATSPFYFLSLVWWFMWDWHGCLWGWSSWDRRSAHIPQWGEGQALRVVGFADEELWDVVDIRNKWPIIGSTSHVIG